MKRSSIAPIVVSILVAVFVLAVLTGKKVPLISGDKAAFIILFILGFSMSVLAGIRDGDETFEGMAASIRNTLIVLGLLAVVLFIVILAGVKVPLISGYREAFAVMATIIASKWAIVHAYNLIH